MKHLSAKPLAMASLMMIACSADPRAESVEPIAESVNINVNPATLAEATESVAGIERLMRLRTDDPRAHEALGKLLPRLDELNHLVARVEARPGHVVSFYESEPGVIGIVEAAPAGSKRVLSPSDMQEALVPLYERLSGGKKAPASLVQAEARVLVGSELTGAELAPGPVSTQKESLSKAGAEEVGSTTQALTEGDGQWFRDNGCFKTGDYRACLPNRWGNTWFDYNTRTSFMTLAPFNAPSPITVNLKYNGAQRFVYPVFQGEWINFSWYSGLGSCGFFACVRNLVIANHHWDLFEADGKGYHWSVAAKWNCNATTCKEWP